MEDSVELIDALENIHNETEKSYTRLKSAVECLKQKQFNEALNYCEVEISKALDPYWIIAKYIKGVSLCSLNEPSLAFEVFKEVKGYSRNSTSAPSFIFDKATAWMNYCSSQKREPLDQVESLKKSADGPKMPTDVRMDWFQNPSSVFITFFCKNLKDEDVYVSFTECTLTVKIILSNTPLCNHHYVIENLYEKIDCSASTYGLSPAKLEVTLKKQIENLTWESLEKPKSTTNSLSHRENIYAASKTLSYPSSNLFKRDWSHIDKECENELKKDKKEGEEALNDFFKEIYASSDENTQRAMIKSFQTSAGTVLSTNWNEVKDTDYAKNISPPDGLELKKW